MKGKVRLWALMWALACLSLAALPAGAQTLEYWAWFQFDDEDLEAMSQTIGAEVVLREVPFDEYHDQLLVNVIGGTPPDLVLIDPQWFDSFVSAGVLTDLTPYVQRDGATIMADVFPAGLDRWSAYGVLYAVPWNVAPMIYWYNSTMMDELGLAAPGDDFNWDQFRQYARIATRDVTGDGLHDAKGLMPWWFDWATLVWSNGGQIFEDGKFALDSGPAREALAFYRTLWEEQLVMNWNELNHLGFNDGDTEQVWRSGYVLFAPGGDWVGPNALETANFDVGAAHVARAPNGNRVGLLGGNGLAIPYGAKNPDLSWLGLLQQMSLDQQNRIAFEGQLPGRITAARSSAYMAGVNATWDLSIIPAAVEYQRGPDVGVLWSRTYAIWNSPVKQHLEQYFQQQAGLTEAIENARIGVEAILAELEN